jgi:hypothetical protein
MLCSVALAFNPSYLRGAGSRGSQFKDSLGKKFEIPSQPIKLGTPVTPATQEA